MIAALPRLDRPELMDTRALSARELRGALRFLSLTNRFFGGTAVVLDKLNRWSARWPPDKTVSILDVGTGLGDIPVAIARWAARRNRKIRVVGIDIVDEIVGLARTHVDRSPRIEIRRDDVRDLHRRGERFDYVIASLFLHHIPPRESAGVMACLDALANRGVIVSDLHRSRMSLAAVSLLSGVLGNAVVRHDGPLSVRRAFRPEELSNLAARAGLAYLSVRREPWFRVSLSGEKV